MKESPATVEEKEFRESLKPGQFCVELFETIPDAHFFVKNRDSRFMAVSAGFAAMYGVERPDSMLGMSDHDFTADFLADAFVADDRRVMDSGKPLVGKVELVPIGDSLDWLTTTKVPLWGINSRVIGLAGVTRRTRDDDDLYRHHPEIHRIVDFIRTHFRGPIALADLAAAGGVSISSVSRRFLAAFGLTPMRYLKMTRLNAACRALRKTREPLTEIARTHGFNDQTSMNRDFRAELNITPRQYRVRFSRTGRGRPPKQPRYPAATRKGNPKP
jgi:AraC-like DNA-binding protein